MSIKRRVIKGKKYWVIDRLFRRPDGEVERYRRVAQVQTRPGAETEERHIIDHWLAHGTIAPLVAAAKPAPKATKKTSATWDEAVKHFRAVILPKKKPSTRKGYEVALEGPWLSKWSGKPLSSITRAAVEQWDTSIAKSGVKASTRRNQHIVLRSVLRSVGPLDGEPGVLIDALPSLPRLPHVGQSAVSAPHPDDVARLVSENDDEQRQPVWSARRKKARLAFALGIYAGMRASEIRGLRRRDVDLRSKTITIRLARVAGEEATPKSGDAREIPIDPRLESILTEACKGLDPSAYVATTYEGTPWSDNGIWAALRRATGRLGIEPARVHGLRHYFASALFGSGADARTVQALLGHSSLEVTQRYAHHSRDRARAAIAAMASVALIMLGCGASASVHDDDNDDNNEDNTCDWRFIDGCVVRGEEGDACQTEYMCQDGLRCDRPSDDRRTWTCVLDD